MPRRFAVIVLQMRIGSTTEKQSSCLHGILPRRVMERRVAVFVRRVDVGAAVDKKFCRSADVSLHSTMERRLAVFVRPMVGKAVDNTPWHGTVPYQL